MDEEEYFQQFDMSGMTPEQQLQFKESVRAAFSGRPSFHPTTGAVDDEGRSLSSYSSDVQNLRNNPQLKGIFQDVTRDAYSTILRDNGVSSEEWLFNHPEATTIDVIRAANLGNFNDSESFYLDPESTDAETFDREKALSRLEQEAQMGFEKNYVFPKLGGALNELIPENIRNNPEKLAQFESMFLHETGLKLDFDESGRVGDINTDSFIGNSFREVGRVLNDLAVNISDWAISTPALITELTSDLSPSARDLRFKISQQEGETQTLLERAEGPFWKDDIFWASFVSPEARRQLLLGSKSAPRTKDLEALFENGDDASIGDYLGASVDLLVESAPLLLDIATAKGLATGALKTATKGVTKRAATKAAKKTAYDPVRIAKTGKLNAADAARKIENKAILINKAINGGGAFVLSDVLVSGHMHADNVGQEWYDNLSASERAVYLAEQSSAEVLSGMVLGGLLRGKGVLKGLTRKMFEGQKSAVLKWGSQIARGTFFGVAEESIAEGATAGWQYASEIRARQAGGDATAIFSPVEFRKRVFDAVAAGALMGGTGGFAGGTISGGAQAFVAKHDERIVKKREKLKDLARAADEAITTSDKDRAIERLESETKKHSGAQSAITRAYDRLRKKNPKAFDNIARVQGEVNALVQVYKELAEGSDDAWKKDAKNEIKALLEKKQQLESEAFEGDQTLDDVIKEELEAVSEERKGKVEAWEQSQRESPEAQAEKLLKEEFEAQNASLEAAIAVNSAEQTADDDVQDATEEQPMPERDPDAEVDGVTATADNLAKEGASTHEKFKDLRTKVNMLLKAFKAEGMEVVFHNTAESYYNRTGSDPKRSKGAIDGKTIHINLSHERTTAKTVRHEFLHAAFRSVKKEDKEKFFNTLKALYPNIKIEGYPTFKAFEEAVAEAYEGKSADVVLEEKIVILLEHALDEKVLSKTDKSVLRKLIDGFLKLFGLSRTTELDASDLKGFVEAFRAAEREGTAFETDKAVDGDTTMESRDLGPSKAYPDLIDKEVRYVEKQFDDSGGAKKVPVSKVFKDYWHFRNWWLQETDNGRSSDTVEGFEYTRSDGTIRNINPPRPKVDPKTGRPVSSTSQGINPARLPEDTPFEVYYWKAGRDGISRIRSMNFNGKWHFINWWVQATRKGESETFSNFKLLESTNPLKTTSINTDSLKSWKGLEWKPKKLVKDTPRSRGLREQINAHKEFGGSTFTLDGKNQTGQPVSSVSIFPERSETIKGPGLWVGALERHAEANADILEGNEDVLAVGTWFDSESNQTYLDIVAVVSHEQAVTLGRQYNQKAVFNLETMEEVDTGGTGEAVEGLKPEAERVNDIRALSDADTDLDDVASSDAEEVFESVVLGKASKSFFKRLVKAATETGKKLIAFTAFYDPTNIKGSSGIHWDWDPASGAYGIYSFSKKDSAKEVKDKMEAKASANHNKPTKDAIVKGFFLINTGLMGRSSAYSNREIVADVIAEIEEILKGKTDFQAKTIIKGWLKDIFKSGSDNQKDLIRGVFAELNDKFEDKVGFGTETLLDAEKTHQIPITKEALIEWLTAFNKLEPTEYGIRRKNKFVRHNLFGGGSDVSVKGILPRLGYKVSSDAFLETQRVGDKINPFKEGDSNSLKLMKRVPYTLKATTSIMGGLQWELQGFEITKKEGDSQFPWSISLKEGYREGVELHEPSEKIELDDIFAEEADEKAKSEKDLAKKKKTYEAKKKSLTKKRIEEIDALAKQATDPRARKQTKGVAGAIAAEEAGDLKGKEKEFYKAAAAFKEASAAEAKRTERTRGQQNIGKTGAAADMIAASKKAEAEAKRKANPEDTTRHSFDLDLSGTGDIVKKAAKAAGKKGIAISVLEAMKAKASKVEQAIINDVIAAVNKDVPESRYVTEEQLEKAISQRMLSPLEDESTYGDYGIDRIGRSKDAVDPSLTPLVGDTDHWGEAFVDHTKEKAHAHMRTSGMKSDPQSLYVLEMQSDAVQKSPKKRSEPRVFIEDEVEVFFGTNTKNEAFIEDIGRNPDKYISEVDNLKPDNEGNTSDTDAYWRNIRRLLVSSGGLTTTTADKMIELALAEDPTFPVDGLNLMIKHYAMSEGGAPIDVTTEQAKKIFEDRWSSAYGYGHIIADAAEDLMEMYKTLKGEPPRVFGARLEEYYKVKESLKPKPEAEKKDLPVRKLWERHVINSALQRAREKGKKKIKIPTGRTATAIQNWAYPFKVEDTKDMVSYKNQLSAGVSVIHDRYSKAGSTMQKMGLKGVKLVKDSQGFEWHEALVPAEGDAPVLFSMDLDFEGTDTNLPFEPNRLNYFQAMMARMDQLFANKYANVMRLQKDIQKGIGKAVELGQDFINAETLLYGRTANDLEKLEEKVKEISKDMKAKGLTSEEVTEYLIARHAKERNAVIKKRNKKKDGSGLSDADADSFLSGLSADKKAKFESLAKKIDAIQKDTRDTMRKYGLESNERIDAFEAMFENYVPLGGKAVDDMNVETTSYPTGGAGIAVYGDTTKRAKGRKSLAVNVLAQVIAQNAAVHTKARKNEALSSLYNLVKANPNERVWLIKDVVTVDSQNAVGVRIDGEQKYIVFNDPSYAKSLRNMGVEKLDVISKIIRVPAAWLRRSFTTANPEFIISNFARDIQSALFNGLAEADIPGGQIQGRHIAANIIAGVKSTLPALIKGTFGKDMGAEMEAYFEEFKEDGGQTGWGFVKPLNQIAAEIEAESTEPGKVKKAVRWMGKHSIDVIENVNDAFENSIRLSAYIESRKAGVSRAKAAELAKNITVNFNRSGELGPVANAWYLFFNASVQGTVRLARSLGTLKDVRKPDGELEAWHKRLNAAQKLAFGLSLTSGMLAAVNMAMSDEDEDGVLFYSKIPDYVKERNLIIMYDGKNHLKIPLPYGFNIFSNFGTAMAEVAAGEREMTEATMFMANSAFSSFSPISFGQSETMAKYITKGFTPTVLKPFVEISTNETYFGSSVFREQFPVGAPKPESELAFRSPEMIQKIFSWMNKATGGSEQVPGGLDFNPDKFWYGLEYYIGGAGQFVTRSLGTGRDMFEMMKEGKKVKMSANDFPFLRKVYGESSKYYDSDSYTENSNLISQLYKERKESDDKRSDRYAGVTKLESKRKSTEKKLKVLRKKRKEARDIKNYVEKQNRIHELYEKERSLLMEFNKAFEKYYGKK